MRWPFYVVDICIGFEQNLGLLKDEIEAQHESKKIINYDFSAVDRWWRQRWCWQILPR